MRRFVQTWVICAVVAVVAAGQPKPAEYVDALTNIETTTRVIENAGVKIAVDVDPRHPLAIQPSVRQVTHEGTGKNPDAFRVELKKEGDASFLLVTPGTGAAAAGKYTVRIRIPRLLKAPLKEGEAPPPDQVPWQTIDLTLTRSAPGAVPKSAVVMPSPLKIERVIEWNGKVSYEPKDWLMRETTGRASILPDPKVTRAHLVSQTTSGLGMVRVTFPEVIEAAQEKRAEVALEGGPTHWIGDAAATILVRSDSLAAPLKAYSVQVHSRYSWWWLFLTILVGVVLGSVTNRLLIPRIAAMNARAKAAEEHDRLIALRARFVDAGIIGEIDRIVATLDDAIRNKQLKGEEVTEAAAKAATDAGTVVANADAKLKELTGRINAILRAVRHPQALTGTLRDLSYRATNRAQALHASLADGQLGSVEPQVTDLEGDLPYDVAVAVPAWKRSITGPLTTIGRWPGFLVDQDLGTLLTDLAAVKEPETLEQVGTTLTAAEHIVRTLRAGLGPVGFEEIRRFVREAIGVLEPAIPGTGKLARLQAAEVALRKFDEAVLPLHLEEGAQAVNDARNALEDALLAAWRPTEDQKTLPGLLEKDYKKALSAVRTQASVPEAMAMPESVEVTEDAAPAGKTPPPPPPKPWQGRELSISARRSSEEYRRAATAASLLRDIILGAFVIGGGMLIFMTTYIGTFADFLGAMLWGFSVNLGAETVTQYAAPLMQRRPFPK